MSEIEIEGRVIPLLLNTKAFVEIETEICCFKDFLQSIKGKKGIKNTMRSVMILGNEAIADKGEKPFITEELLYKKVKPKQIISVKMAIIEAITDGMRTEHKSSGESSGVRDLVLEELNEKWKNGRLTARMLISYGLMAGLGYTDILRLRPGEVMDLFLYRRDYDGALHGVKWEK